MMILHTRPYRVVKPFNLFRVGQILNWDPAIAGTYVNRSLLEPIEETPETPAVETAMIDPNGEKAVKPRGRPRGRRANHADA